MVFTLTAAAYLRSGFKSTDPKHFQHLIPVVVDHLHGDLAGLRAVERAAFGGVQFRPGRFIHLGLERPLQLLVGPVAAGENALPVARYPRFSFNRRTAAPASTTAPSISNPVSRTVPGCPIRPHSRTTANRSNRVWVTVMA